MAEKTIRLKMLGMPSIIRKKLHLQKRHMNK